MEPSGASLDPLFLSFQLAVAGRYSIERELGRGGMGVVYLAREVHLERPVAIKVLPPDRARQTGLRERFLREARLAAKLSHPNIIPIHSVEDAGDFVFYVMAFVDGETLAQRVRQRGPLSSSEATRVLREVAWALAHAHAQGVVHRDVKPDNILLESASGRVLVADFGIAAALGDASGGDVSGTPEFMSPEQALGASVDARSDLYGLGATAFYLLSGRFPFEGTSATEILAKQVTESPTSLASMGLAVPRKIAKLIDRCLAKDPNDRPVNAQTLAEQLGVALQQRREQPVALRAFVKRNARLDGEGTLLGGSTLLFGSVLMSAYFGVTTGFATFVLGGTLGPFAYFVGAARRLSLLGFGYQDVAPAFKAEGEQAREELSVERRLEPFTLERWLPPIAKTAAAAVPIFAAGVAYSGYPYSASMARLFGMAMLGTVLSLSTATLASLAHLSLVRRHRDVDTEFWAKIWRGRIGKAAFSVAARLLGNRVRATAMTHRPTELSLGMAAEQLFQGLPAETRRALGDLPSVLKRLQDDAQKLRKRYEEIQNAISDARLEASDPENADILRTRDEMHEKISAAVGALETIRLNLLRLHAGSGTVGGLTTTLGLAAEVSADVERLIAGHSEVAAMLRFPRQVETTPV
ncbi:MAG: serine/threonine-protein kinase [Gemmatimonadaceae bacterium]